MTSKTTRRFWTCFGALPVKTRQVAKTKYGLWQADPFHPSLHFKSLAPGLWSVRVSQQYRALARRQGDLVVWFWIGTHAEYDQLIEQSNR